MHKTFLLSGLDGLCLDLMSAFTQQKVVLINPAVILLTNVNDMGWLITKFLLLCKIDKNNNFQNLLQTIGNWRW